MNTIPKQHRHLSDEELIGLLYYGEAEDDLLAGCSLCLARSSALQSHRDEIDSQAFVHSAISPERLAAQRRSIYASLSTQSRASSWGLRLPGSFGRRWVSAVATVTLLGGGLLLMEQQRSGTAVRQEDKISDVELAQEVSNLSQSPEPAVAEPLQELFE